MEHRISDNAPVFGLFTCTCGERFDSAQSLDSHIDTHRMISASSLGSEAAKAAIDSVPLEHGRRLVAEAVRRKRLQQPQFGPRCDHYVDESRCARKAHRFGEHHFPVGDWVVIYSGTPDPSRTAQPSPFTEAPESVGRVRSIDWYRFMTAEFATANFGFPDGHARQFGEMHQAPDNSSWIWLGENWEVAQYPPVDKEKGKDS